MIISLSILLIPYALLLLLFCLLAVIHLWHIIKFSAFDSTSIFMLGFFVVATAIILLVTFKFGIEIDWTEPLIVL